MTRVYKRTQFVPERESRVEAARQKKNAALSNSVTYDRVAAFHRGKRTRRLNDARDNFSASSHLIYGVPVMEETCGDSRISSIESGEESPGLTVTEEHNVSTPTMQRFDSRTFRIYSIGFFILSACTSFGFLPGHSLHYQERLNDSYCCSRALKMFSSAAMRS